MVEKFTTAVGDGCLQPMTSMLTRDSASMQLESNGKIMDERTMEHDIIDGDGGEGLEGPYRPRLAARAGAGTTR